MPIWGSGAKEMVSNRDQNEEERPARSALIFSYVRLMCHAVGRGCPSGRWSSGFHDVGDTGRLGVFNMLPLDVAKGRLRAV